jgi:hypothetical protein
VHLDHSLRLSHKLLQIEHLPAVITATYRTIRDAAHFQDSSQKRYTNCLHTKLEERGSIRFIRPPHEPVIGRATSGTGYLPPQRDKTSGDQDTMINADGLDRTGTPYGNLHCICNLHAT